MLTFLSPSHHDSACSGLTKDQLGISFAAQSMDAAAMHDGQYARKQASACEQREISIIFTIHKLQHYYFLKS